MKKNFRISALTSIFIAFILFFVYLFLDYFNIPTAIGIEVSRFNMDVLGIIVNAVVAVAIFALGYHLVEQWNVKKLINQKVLAESALYRCYKSCLYFSNLLEKYCDKNNPLTFKNYSEMMEFISLFDARPFDEETIIQQYLSEGLLTKEQTDNYLSIKNAYKTFVFLKLNPDFKDSFATSVKNGLEELVRTSLDNLSSAQS